MWEKFKIFVKMWSGKLKKFINKEERRKINSQNKFLEIHKTNFFTQQKLYK